jgi:L-lactate dehydrogenase complex protein LldG
VSAREAVLAAVRDAIAGADPPSVPRRYVEAGSAGRAEIVATFVERVRDYKGAVVHTEDARAGVERVLAEHGAQRVGIPRDLPSSVRPAGIDLVEDDALSPAELDGLDGVVTTCAAACALTGTLAFDGGPGQGRRALTLLPDLHVCVVREEQIVETVPELIRQLEDAARNGRPIVLVSGPSATSDIGFERVEGVHGPRRLVVVVEIYAGPVD